MSLCLVIYVGETHRNFFSRNVEHRERLERKDPNNFIFAHQQEKHNGETIDLKMKVEKICKDPLTRQVSEAVLIRKIKGEALNGKMEFNQPRLINMRRELQVG